MMRRIWDVFSPGPLPPHSPLEVLYQPLSSKRTRMSRLEASIYKTNEAVISVSPIITLKPLDRLASNFGWGTRKGSLFGFRNSRLRWFSLVSRQSWVPRLWLKYYLTHTKLKDYLRSYSLCLAKLLYIELNLLNSTFINLFRE